MRNNWLINGMMLILLFCGSIGFAFGQNVADNTEETELVIEDFTTTGLGDNASFGIAIGGLFGGSATLDTSFDFFVSPLVGLRMGIGMGIPFMNSTTSGEQLGAIGMNIGLGAIWRSYVINRIRFYGGVSLNGVFDPLTDFDIILQPEGYGGFEIFASPSVSIFTEFGGKSSIPLFNLNNTDLKTQYTYADGFLFRVGTRFDI